MRSIAAVLGGLVLLAVLWRVMAAVLIQALAGEPVSDAAAYLNEHEGALAATIALQGVAALLAGYMTARIAGRGELLHGGAAAALQTALTVVGFMAAPDAALPPVWARAAAVAVIGPALLAGAAIRARAAAPSEMAAQERPGEQS